MTLQKQNGNTDDKRPASLKLSMKTSDSLEGYRVLILVGAHEGEEGICLGETGSGNRWAVSPDTSIDILQLTFEREFALLLDLSASPSRN